MNLGRNSDALAPLERAVRICEKKTCDLKIQGTVLFNLARALVATSGSTDRALTLARQTKQIFGKEPKRHQKELAELQAWLDDLERGNALAKKSK